MADVKTKCSSLARNPFQLKWSQLLIVAFISLVFVALWQFTTELNGLLDFVADRFIAPDSTLRDPSLFSGLFE